MVVQKLFGSVILRTAGGRTVEDEVADTVWSAHQLAVLHTGEEGLFARHLLATNSQGITVVGHARKGIKGVQLVIPSAVRAAMAAWIMAFTIEAQVIFEELNYGESIRTLKRTASLFFAPLVRTARSIVLAG